MAVRFYNELNNLSILPVFAQNQPRRLENIMKWKE
jgi:hypothetical protein